MRRLSLDALDRRLIHALGQDGRVSNRQIATSLGVAEATVRTRIKRLQNEHLIQFTALTDFRMVGSPTLVLFGIHADPGRVPKLAVELSALGAINCVIVLLGRFNLLATGLFRSMTEVDEINRQSILPLKGVRRVETMVSMQQFKYEYRMARIVVRPKSLAGARTSAARHGKARGPASP
jgi:Lrp/AsnC family transcriptional regulator, regulator for asnA, asnC and gidA